MQLVDKCLITGGFLCFCVYGDIGILPNIQSALSSNTSLWNTQSLSLDNEKLFESPRSPGNVAICAAEGNCLADGSGKHSSLYLQGGHFDPANRVFNRGFCSDQGRGKNMADADLKCVERNKSRLPLLTNLMKSAGVRAEKHTLAWVNAVDLWNQASPRVSNRFPSEYKKALQKGLTELESVKLARVEAFRNRQGRLDAGGLKTVCSKRWSSRLKQEVGLIGLVPGTEEYMKRCIGYDQSRRTHAIAITLRNYNP